MANGSSHRVFAALALGGAIAHHEHRNGTATLRPLVGAGVAALTTNLPDMLEPAIHPHHRQFFHSIAFATGVGVIGKKIWDWSPEDDAGKNLRFILLTVCGAYLVHLALDSMTSKSLPFVGKL